MMIAFNAKRVLAIYIGLLVLTSIGAAFAATAGTLAYALNGGSPSSFRADGEPSYQWTDIVDMPEAKPLTEEEMLLSF